jgi:hypothetical protein
MRNKQAQELLNKAVKLKQGEKIPLFKGIYIIQERKLHNSGYRLMNIIGHTEYDKELNDYKYYLISCCSDVIDFEPIFNKLLEKNYDMCDLHLDINKNGLIHIWTNSDKKISCKYGLNLSACGLEII